MTYVGSIPLVGMTSATPEAVRQQSSLPQSKIDGEVQFDPHLDPSRSWPKVIIIESRSLLQGCLAVLIGQGLGQSVLAFNTIDEWAAHPDAEDASLVIYCAHDSFLEGEAKTQLQQLLRLAGDVPVVLSSDVEEADAIVEVLELGAKGYIPTSMKLEIWIEALRLVKAGGIYVPASTLLKIGGPPRVESAKQPNDSAVSLTSRQMAVVYALSQGKANKIIAYELNMCESTVKVHVRNIMKKLRAKNRTEVALMASELLRRS